MTTQSGTARTPIKKGRALLSLLLSVAMAFGTVPSPALAEALDEVQLATEEEPLAGDENTGDASASVELQEDDADEVQLQEDDLDVVLLDDAVPDNSSEVEGADAQGELAVGDDAQAELLEADDSEEEPVELFAEGEVQTVRSDEALDNDALLDAYVQSKIDESLPGSDDAVLSLQSAENSLEGKDLAVYRKLKSLVAQVAAGELSSTEFSIPLSSYMDDYGPWTAGDLGVSAIVKDRAIAQDAKAAVYERISIDISAVNRALLADCPYELYWYDKTVGVSYSYPGIQTVYSGEYALEFAGDLTITMYVAQGYSESEAERTTAVNTNIGESVATAINNASSIVSTHAGESTIKRLGNYRQEICDLVSYNHDAADNSSTPYGNPWQLIWVFDGDESTNVVCEGYSKAFKYLCDLTWPGDDQDVECLLATGTMNGGTGEGAHMWNVVRMDDDKNYLVDVTNCDEGTIGAPDELFMAYGPTGSLEDGYTFTAGNSSIAYVYDSKTLSVHGNEALTISATKYQGPAEKIKVSVPAVAAGLVYNGSAQVGVASGEGYELTGTTSATNAGTYTTTVTLNSNYQWADGTTDAKDLTWHILAADISSATFSNISSRVYTGTSLEPKPTVTLGNITLELGEDYTLSYENNVNVGTATIVATGKGNYTGTCVVTFSITPAASTIKLAAQTKTYTGKAIAYTGRVTKTGSTGKVTYTYYSDAKCAKVVKAANVKAAGTYYVKAKVAAKGNYKAATSVAAKLTVAKAANPLKATAVARTAKLAAVKKKAVTVAAPLKVTNASKGKLSYKKASGSKFLTVNAKTGKVTVKKGTKKGTYTVKIKVTSVATTNYKAGTKTVTCKVVVK